MLSINRSIPTGWISTSITAVSCRTFSSCEVSIDSVAFERSAEQLVSSSSSKRGRIILEAIVLSMFLLLKLFSLSNARHKPLRMPIHHCRDGEMIRAIDLEDKDEWQRMREIFPEVGQVVRSRSFWRRYSFHCSFPVMWYFFRHAFNSLASKEWKTNLLEA